MLYSESTNSFYERSIHGARVPSDAIEITKERHTYLLDGQSGGKRIQSDETGYPILVDSPEPTQSEKDEKRVQEIDTRLRQIDVESDRPLRAIEVARARGETPNQYDIDRLINLEDEAETLRAERKGLTQEALSESQ